MQQRTNPYASSPDPYHALSRISAAGFAPWARRHVLTTSIVAALFLTTACGSATAFLEHLPAVCRGDRGKAYAYSPDNPVRVGGGIADGPARTAGLSRTSARTRWAGNHLFTPGPARTQRRTAVYVRSQISSWGKFRGRIAPRAVCRYVPHRLAASSRRLYILEGGFLLLQPSRQQSRTWPHWRRRWSLRTGCLQCLRDTRSLSSIGVILKPHITVGAEFATGYIPSYELSDDRFVGRRLSIAG